MSLLLFSSFEGSGASKKLAKQACARAVLTKLYGMTFTPMGGLAQGAGDGSLMGPNADPSAVVPGENEGNRQLLSLHEIFFIISWTEEGIVLKLLEVYFLFLKGKRIGIS